MPLQVYMEVQQWDPPSPELRGMVPIGSMTIPAQVLTRALCGYPRAAPDDRLRVDSEAPTSIRKRAFAPCKPLR